MSSSPQGKFEASQFWASSTRSRNFESSARLHLQHHLFQRTLGNRILQPTAEQAAVQCRAPLRVADLGCGNGVWLLDLEQSLTDLGVEVSLLEGFDVNPVNFPPKWSCSPNVSFTALDVLKPLPQELLGTYDIVHMRAFVSLITKNDPRPAIDQALSLLKPGGWLQWEETRVDRWTATAAQSGEAEDAQSKASCDAIIGILDNGGRAQGNTFDFLATLGVHLERAGLVQVASLESEKRRADMKAWTEDYLLSWEEIANLIPPKAQAPDSPFTREMYEDLLDKAIAETEQGVAIHQQSVLVVMGRKPE
ncbi:hypothetical protein LEL_05846 [Akanthomyces lecanii RCEF 1005]|uniref:Methyltransferase domain-containing protein n=1 Tax=Akanthomyces lecanii RCEF 1005 TaxID=1081108 RepID=A0A162K0G3_CORDF|nr:hypothetical protein LEL_05846 [Akanthomyces lecanii RCEF 1005]